MVGSNNSATAAELLAEGLRCEKGGLLDKALGLYREARRNMTDPALLAESWRLEAYAHHGRCHWDDALTAARRSGDIARDAQRTDLVAEALNAEAAVHLARGEHELARPLFEGMLTLVDDPRIRGLAFQNLGIIHAQRGALDLAEQHFEEAYQEFEAADYRWGKTYVLTNTVALCLDRENYERAESTARRAVREARDVADLDLLAIATLNLAEALAGLGQFEAAESEASTALGHFTAAGNQWRRVACLRFLGDMSTHRGDERLARVFWEHGLSLAKSIGARNDEEGLMERLRDIPAGDEA